MGISATAYSKASIFMAFHGKEKENHAATNGWCQEIKFKINETSFHTSSLKTKLISGL